MRRGLVIWTIVLVAALGYSSSAFAQVYGTDGGSPGAWPKKDVPAKLSEPKPFDAHDLSGVWAHANEFQDVHWFGEHGGQGGTNGPDYWVIRPPLTEWGQDQLDQHFPGPNGQNDAKAFGNRSRIDGFDNSPLSKCDPLGYPHSMMAALDRPFEFIPAADRLMMHVQYHEVWRQIWTDGRSLPKPEDIDPAWNGYSVGKWDGDTFVVTSTGYNPDSWFDRNGDPRSPEGVLVERWHRVDADTLQLQMTLTDPKAYTKPWVDDVQTFKRAKYALYEEICVPSEEEFFQTNQRNVALGDAKKANVQK